MLGRLFRGCKSESDHKSPSSKMVQQTLQMLEEKESVLQKKIDLEFDKAKQLTKAKNKQAAMQCLKRKKFYENQIEQLENFQSRIHDQEKKLPQKEQSLPQKCAGQQ